MAYRTGLYALPIAGRFIYEYDRMKDYGKMAKDYRRNTGRTSKYATQGYEASKQRKHGQQLKASKMGTCGTTGTHGKKCGSTVQECLFLQMSIQSTTCCQKTGSGFGHRAS